MATSEKYNELPAKLKRSVSGKAIADTTDIEMSTSDNINTARLTGNILDGFFDKNTGELIQATLTDEISTDDFVDNIIYFKYKNKYYKRVRNDYKFIENTSSFDGLYNTTEGDVIMTYGFYKKGDGGACKYIVYSDTTTVPDNYITFRISTSLIAIAQFDGAFINFKSIGGKVLTYGEDRFDNNPVLLAYQSYLSSKKYKISLYLDSGCWLFSPTLIKDNSIFISAEKSFTHPTVGKNAAFIAPFSNSQSYVWRLENLTNYSVEEVVFTTSAITINSDNSLNTPYTSANIWSTTDSTVVIVGCEFGFFRGFFQYINGTSLRISSTWETYFDLLNFRYCFDWTKPVLLFDNVTSPYGGNITACSFEKIMFEVTEGPCIQVNPLAVLANCDFGTINFEDYPDTRSAVQITSSWVASSNTQEIPLIKTFGGSEIVVDKWMLNNIFYYSYTNNSVEYVYSSLVGIDLSSSTVRHISLINNNVDILGYGLPIKLVKRLDSGLSRGEGQNNIVFNTISHYNSSNFVPFNLDFSNISTYIQLPDVYTNNSVIAGATSGGLYFTDYIATPAVKLAFRTGSNFGGIYGPYNGFKTIQNPYKQVVKSVTVSSVAAATYDNCCVLAFRMTGKVVILRAIIPSGVIHTVRLYMSGTVYQDFQLTGTGAYASYSMEFTASVFTIGAVFRLSSVDTVTNDIFYDTIVIQGLQETVGSIASPSDTTVISSVSAEYSKIGRQVSISGGLTFVTANTSSNITLPFTPKTGQVITITHSSGAVTTLTITGSSLTATVQGSIAGWCPLNFTYLSAS